MQVYLLRWPVTETFIGSTNIEFVPLRTRSKEKAYLIKSPSPTPPPLPLQACTWETPNMGMYTVTIKI